MGKISKAVRGVADIYNGASLIVRIIVGLIIGTVLALTMPHVTWIGEFGTLFVAALKAAAPILVFVLVASALAQGTSKLDRRFGTVLFLYLFTTFLAAVVAVLTSRLFPQTLSLGKAAKADVVPQGLSEVIQTLLTNIVANPIQAIIDGNYICILMWACLFGLAMKSIANESSKAFMANVADAVSQVIRWVINLAPFGIMGLVFTNVADNGLSAFTKYGSLLLLLVGTMLLMVLVFGPLVIFIFLRRNPYPLVYRCFKESGLTAFFTRSSAANIPVNMQLGGNSENNILGWERDTDDEDYDAEVDKKMRNNGFMKGPEYIVAVAGGRETNRMNAGATRRIVVREAMSPDVTYYIRFKTVQPDYTTKQLFVDMALTVGYTLTASLIVALTFVPAAASLSQ